MAIVCENEHGWVVDHQLAIDRVYQVTSNCGQCVRYRINGDLFAVEHPFMMDSQFQASRTAPVSGEVSSTNGDIVSNSGHISSTSRDGSPTSRDVAPISGGISTVSGGISTVSGDIPTVSLQLSRGISVVSADITATSDRNVGSNIGHGVAEENASLSRRKRKTRKRKSSPNSGEVRAIEYHNQVRNSVLIGYKSLRELAQTCKHLCEVDDHSRETNPDNNSRARRASAITGPGDRLAQLCDMAKDMDGSNHTAPVEWDVPVLLDVVNRVIHHHDDIAKVATLVGGRYIIPPHCSFLLSDMSRIHELVRDAGDHHRQYDLIVVDPPWQNKSVKRQKKYGCMSEWELLDLPLSGLARPGCIVAIWVTNRQKQHRFVRDYLFPAWSVTQPVEWHWLKVTKHGEMVYNFDSPHKKPYETLILGKYKLPDVNCTRGHHNRNHKNSVSKNIIFPKATSDTGNSQLITGDTRNISLATGETGNSPVATRDTGHILVEDTGNSSVATGDTRNSPVTFEDTGNLIQVAKCTASLLSNCGQRTKHNSGEKGCVPNNFQKPEFSETDGQKVMVAGQSPDPSGSRHDVWSRDAALPDKKLIISVPCSIHSKKPPLSDILRAFLPEQPACLELFARNLWPEWTSWGNEVLLHQHVDFYQ